VDSPAIVIAITDGSGAPVTMPEAAGPWVV
jgi:hypothetical protein